MAEIDVTYGLSGGLPVCSDGANPPSPLQNGITDSFEYPPLPTPSSSFESPSLSLYSKSLSFKSCTDTSFTQTQKKVDMTLTDEDSISLDLDSDVYFSSGDQSRFDLKGNCVVDDEISDLLGSLKLRNKSGSYGEERNPAIRHSYHFPPTHNEIRNKTNQEFTRRRAVSTSSALSNIKIENPFLLGKHFTSQHSSPHRLELSAYPLLSTNNQLIIGLINSPIQEEHFCIHTKSAINSNSLINMTELTKPSTPNCDPVGNPPTTLPESKVYSPMSSKTPSRLTTRSTAAPPAASHRATVARTSPKSTGSAAKTVTLNKTASSTALKSPSITPIRKTSQLGYTSPKVPTISKSRSSSALSTAHVTPSSKTGLGDRITNTASQVRPKTPTLAPNFQSLSAKKTPLHSQTTTKSLERRSVSSISNNNRGSSALNSVRSRSTENLLTENKSPTKARSKTTPLQSSISPPRQTSSSASKNATKQTPTNKLIQTTRTQLSDKIRASSNTQGLPCVKSQIISPVKSSSVTPSRSRGGGSLPNIKVASPNKTLGTTATVRNTRPTISRSNSVSATLPQSRIATNTKVLSQSAQKPSPVKRQTSAGGAPFKRTPILQVSNTKVPSSTETHPPPSISITSSDNDPFGIPLIAPTRPEVYNHKLQIKTKVQRPSRGLLQKNVSDNYLETLTSSLPTSRSNSPAHPKGSPDISDSEDPRQTKLDVKSFKFLLKTREKDSLLLGAAERSPIYTSHEHVLIKVKGKRQVHARITEPKVASINKGNAYIYISLQELWLWVGPEANPAEVSKARSLANRIFKQKELGCKAIFLSEIDFKEQTFNTTRTHALFSALGAGEREIQASSCEDSDEIYEKGMALSTKVYEVVLLENGQYIASIIHEDKYISVKTSILKTEKVLVFDFGTEVYLWVGKQSASDPQMRKQGEKMAKDIFDNCYSAPSFDPNFILTKTSSPNPQHKPPSLMTNRATGQKEQNTEGKATGASSTDRNKKTVPTLSSQNSGLKSTNLHLVAKSGSNTTPKSSTNRNKAVSSLGTSVNASATKGAPSTATRDRVTNIKQISLSTSASRTQTSRPSSTPPKKAGERRPAVTLQAPNLSRTKSTTRGSIAQDNTSHLPNRPRSQEGNREDMLAPEHKPPVYTNQARPAYSVLARMNEGAETVLFGDKFSDWKGALGIISTKPPEQGKKSMIAAHVELKPCDTQLMLIERKVPSSIVDPLVNRLKENNVKTVSLKKWLVKEYNNEFKHYEMNEDKFHIFYSKECYVYKWIYEHASLFPSRSNNLKTTSANKERGMIFFWQGDGCSINAKGAVAAISIEIDEEGDLHKERLPQGREDALFLQLFNGEMIVYNGKLDDDHGYDKLFFVRGTNVSEASVIEVPPDNLCLNSLGCYIYCCEAEQTVYAWRGAKASQSQQTCLRAAVEKMATRENFTVVHVAEGNEPSVFERIIPNSASSDKHILNTPHLFELCGASGQFTFTQYIPQIYTDQLNALIFLQLDLYSAHQPTIFMLDVHYEVYIWFGWWPDKTHNSRNHVTSESVTNTGVSDTRWQGDKKLAIQTALNYVKDGGRTDCPVYVTFAGSEPNSFKALFPFWCIKKELSDVSRNDNPFHPKGKVRAEDLLATYTRTRYTYEELTRKPLPEGVDPGKLEMYLSEQEFESIFKMKKEEFGKLHSWKQKLLREQHKLY